MGALLALRTPNVHRNRLDRHRQPREVGSLGYGHVSAAPTFLPRGPEQPVGTIEKGLRPVCGADHQFYD